MTERLSKTHYLNLSSLRRTQWVNHKRWKIVQYISGPNSFYKCVQVVDISWACNLNWLPFCHHFSRGERTVIKYKYFNQNTSKDRIVHLWVGASNKLDVFLRCELYIKSIFIYHSIWKFFFLNSIIFLRYLMSIFTLYLYPADPIWKKNKALIA